MTRTISVFLVVVCILVPEFNKNNKYISRFIEVSCKQLLVFGGFLLFFFFLYFIRFKCLLPIDVHWKTFYPLFIFISETSWFIVLDVIMFLANYCLYCVLGYGFRKAFKIYFLKKSATTVVLQVSLE